MFELIINLMDYNCKICFDFFILSIIVGLDLNRSQNENDLTEMRGLFRSNDKLMGPRSLTRESAVNMKTEARVLHSAGLLLNDPKFSIGSGGQIRTADLFLMREMSCHCSTPGYNASLSFFSIAISAFAPKYSPTAELAFPTTFAAK